MLSAEKKLLRVLAGEVTATPPFWLMRQAGRYLPEYRAVRAGCDGFLDLCYSPEKACEVTLQPLRRFGMDAAIIFSDILVIPHALGQGVRFVQGEGPKLDPIRDEAGLAGLKYDPSHLQPVYDAVSLTREKLPEGTALIGFAGAPWTLACYMVEGGGSKDFGVTRRMAREKPEWFTRLIDLLVETIIDYLCRKVEAGVEVVQLFDSWSGILPEEEFDRWVVEPTARIVAGVKARHPEVPVIGFPRLAGVGYVRYAAKTGVDAVSLDPQVPLAWAREELAPRAVLQGNMDPLMLMAEREVLLGRVRRIRESWAGVPFVFNLGHGCTPETPIEAVEALAAALKAPL